MKESKALDHEPAQKKPGIGFVFSNWLEKDNPKELDKETKRRLQKALELYRSDKIAYFLVTGGEFVEGMKKPYAKTMADYLAVYGIPQNVIIEERHSKDTATNVRFGKFLLGLKDMDELPIYYISSDFQLTRVRKIVVGQGVERFDDVYVSSGNSELSATKKLKEFVSLLINT